MKQVEAISEAESGHGSGAGSLRRWLDHPQFIARTLIAAALLRLAFAVGFAAEPVSDAAWYWQAARHLAAGDGYILDGRATAYFPVGYPAVLSMAAHLGGWPILGRLLQVPFSMAIVGLTLLLGRRWQLGERAARLGMLAVALSPVQSWYCAVLLSEPIFTACLLATVLALGAASQGQPRFAVLAGVITGATALIKPQAFLLPALLLLGERRQTAGSLRQRLMRLAVVWVVAAAVIAPWTWRNYKTFGQFVAVSSNGGVNLYLANNPEATGRYVDSPAIHAAIYGRPGEHRSEVERDNAARAAAHAWLTSHPFEALGLALPKLMNFYVPDQLAAALAQAGMHPMGTSLQWLTQALLGLGWLVDLLTMLAVPGLVLAWLRAGRRGALAPWLLLAFWHGLHLVFFGASRFHFPVVPVVLLLAAAQILARPATPPHVPAGFVGTGNPNIRNMLRHVFRGILSTFS